MSLSSSFQNLILRGALVGAGLLLLVACATANDDPSGGDVVETRDLPVLLDQADLVHAEDTGELAPDMSPVDLPVDLGVAFPCEGDEDCPAQLPPDGMCRVSRCVDGGCVLQRAPNGHPCDDGVPCTGGDACQGGVCVAGALNPCDDGNPCTRDHCTGDGECSYEPDDRACDDGSPCTVNDYCVDGRCEGELSPGACPCDTDQDCAEYDDDDLCNGTWLCLSGDCAPAPPVVCALPHGDCESVRCLPETGACVVEAATDGLACDDGDECTVDDRCAQGVCLGSATACPCAVHSDCDRHDDGDRCNGVYRCVSGQCRFEPGTAVVCPILPDACRASVCQPDTGRCAPEALPDGSPCDDGNACVTGETCQAGFCIGGEAAECDDGNPCTFDRCDFYFGCIHEPHDGPCDDGDPCTYGDRCWAGTCQGYPRRCDDGNPCTSDTCQPGLGCVHLPVAGTCSDGNPCTEGDACFDGACLPGPVDLCGNCVADVECARYDDDDLCNGVLACVEGLCRPRPGSIVDCSGPSPACQRLVCDPGTGTCLQSPVDDGLPCNYDNPCRKEGFCARGTCVSTAVSCDDGNPCTEDVCEPVVGCVHSPVSANCDDGNLCTRGDFCLDSVCRPGTYTCMVCDSDEDCAPAENGDICDGVPRCVAGQCLQQEDSLIQCPPQAPDTCAVAVCDAVTGECGTEPLPAGSRCDDGSLCTTNDRCDALSGACVGDPIDCDDGNPCTTDSCLPSVGCVHEPNDDPCDDDNACTTVDRCIQGRCVGLAPVVCSDGDPCTDDLCNRLDGTCSHTLNAAPCDDGDACTMLDQCVVGECWGQPVPCDDGNPCTTDYCDPAVGCVYVFNEDECDDGQPCSLGDRCSMGACLAGVWVCNEYCGDGIDNDNDLLVDCLDPDCADYPLCVGEGACEPVGPVACDGNVTGDLASNDATDRIISYGGCREGDYAGPEIAWRFVAPRDGVGDVRVVIPTAAYAAGLRVDVFVIPEDELGYCIANTGCIAWGLMGQFGTQGRSQAFFQMQAGRAYYLVADGQREAVTTLDLQILCY